MAAPKAPTSKATAILRSRLAVLLELEDASIEFVDAARGASMLDRDAPLGDVTKAHVRWKRADGAWREAVEACRTSRRRGGRTS